MKSIITLLGIAIMSALVTSGCDKNSSSDAPGDLSTNSSMSGSSTNLQITNSLPDMKTNQPAGSNLSGLF